MKETPQIAIGGHCKLIIQLSQRQYADLEKKVALWLQDLQKTIKEDKEAQKYLSEGLDLPHWK